MQATAAASVKVTIMRFMCPPFRTTLSKQRHLQTRTAQTLAHVDHDAERNRVQVVMCAAAVADREIERLLRRKIGSNTESVVCRQVRPSYDLRFLNSTVDGLGSPGRDIESGRRHAKPFGNPILGAELEVGQLSVGRKRTLVDERVGYLVREAYFKERRTVAEAAIVSIRPIIGRVAGRNSVGRAAGGRTAGELGLEIHGRIRKRQPNLPVDVAQRRKRVCRRGSRG